MATWHSYGTTLPARTNACVVVGLLALIDCHVMFPKDAGVSFVIQHFAHFAGKGSCCVRFGKKCDTQLKHTMLGNGDIGVTRSEQDFEIRIVCFQPLCHHFATHYRHDDISDHQTYHTEIIYADYKYRNADANIAGAVWKFEQGKVKVRVVYFLSELIA